MLNKTNKSLIDFVYDTRVSHVTPVGAGSASADYIGSSKRAKRTKKKEQPSATIDPAAIAKGLDGFFNTTSNAAPNTPHTPQFPQYTPQFPQYTPQFPQHTEYMPPSSVRVEEVDDEYTSGLPSVRGTLLRDGNADGEPDIAPELMNTLVKYNTKEADLLNKAGAPKVSILEELSVPASRFGINIPLLPAMDFTGEIGNTTFSASAINVRTQSDVANRGATTGGSTSTGIEFLKATANKDEAFFKNIEVEGDIFSSGRVGKGKGSIGKGTVVGADSGVLNVSKVSFDGKKIDNNIEFSAKAKSVEYEGNEGKRDIKKQVNQYGLNVSDPVANFLNSMSSARVGNAQAKRSGGTTSAEIENAEANFQNAPFGLERVRATGVSGEIDADGDVKAKVKEGNVRALGLGLTVTGAAYSETGKKAKAEADFISIQKNGAKPFNVSLSRATYSRIDKLTSIAERSKIVIKPDNKVLGGAAKIVGKAMGNEALTIRYGEPVINPTEHVVAGMLNNPFAAMAHMPNLISYFKNVQQYL